MQDICTLSFVPSVIEVRDNRFPVDQIEVHVSEEVEIVEATMVDRNSTIVATFDQKLCNFRLRHGELKLAEMEGELVASFVVTYKGKKANYSVRVPYAPKPTARVIPYTVAFKGHEDGYQGRMVVLGFGPSDNAAPQMSLERKLSNESWEKTNIEFKIDHFGNGKAIGRFILPKDQSVILPDVKSRFRLIFDQTNIPFVEFDGVLVK